MNPTANQVHHPPPSGGRLKGSIGVVVRVHYIWQTKKSDNSMTSACRGATGQFKIVADDSWVTCPKCLQMERTRSVPKMVEIA